MTSLHWNKLGEDLYFVKCFRQPGINTGGRKSPGIFLKFFESLRILTTFVLHTGHIRGMQKNTSLELTDPCRREEAPHSMAKNEFLDLPLHVLAEAVHCLTHISSLVMVDRILSPHPERQRKWRECFLQAARLPGSPFFLQVLESLGKAVINMRLS